MVSNNCQLYLITPANFDLDDFNEDLLKALDGGAVSALQVRLKEASDYDICHAIEKIKLIIEPYKTSLILNDRPDLAHEMSCDGVHIGQNDTSYEETRRIVGPDKIVGVTCHGSRHLAMEASEKGANYVAFGSFFPTKTKKVSVYPEVQIIHTWAETTIIPCVAIGGINHKNCKALIDAGADYLAVISSVWEHPSGPKQAVEKFNKLFKS